MDVFKLSRTWFDFCFENPEKIKPNHSALYFFCIEHCNRLGWKEKFGLPTTMAKEAIGISSYNTYIQTLNDLVNWGFIKLVEKSKNQYSSNIIALSNYNKALNKALDKALIKHATKQSESTVQSIDSIDIQETNIQETINNSVEKNSTPRTSKLSDSEKKEILRERYKTGLAIEINNLYPTPTSEERKDIKEFIAYWCEPNKSLKKMKFEMEKTWDTKLRLNKWFSNKDKFAQKSFNKNPW